MGRWRITQFVGRQLGRRVRSADRAGRFGNASVGASTAPIATPGPARSVQTSAAMIAFYADFSDGTIEVPMFRRVSEIKIRNSTKGLKNVC